MEIESPIVVLIPAYKPDQRLVDLCAKLLELDLPVLLVDDGGGEKYRHLFDAAHALGCRVERHAVNLGKGRALKTGINTAMGAWPNLAGIVTADADGQHTCEDILHIIAAMREHPRALVTGARVLKEMPLKSRFGNTLTRHVYRFVTGIRCTDTQTGLRGLPAVALGDMLRMPGERYEYEMTMLLKLRDLKMALVEVPIDTIYIDDNKGSHFNPFKDSIRVYSVILRFLLSSIVSFGVDYALYLFLLKAIHLLPWQGYALARALSSLLNYSLNRMAVFGGRGGKASIVRYYLLAAAMMAIGAGLVALLTDLLDLSATWVKIPVDVVLFFLSYVIQRDFVFGDGWRHKKGEQTP